MTETENEELPIGARVLNLPVFEASAELAERIAESGGSDQAVDAAGGPGTADRLRRAASDADAA